MKRWTNGRFVLRAGDYTARPPGDVDAPLLEQIYRGLKAEVGAKEAGNFVAWVSNLPDLSASAFIQSFEQFWASECSDTDPHQREGTSYELQGHGDVFALMASAFNGPRLDHSYIVSQSRRLKQPFLDRHPGEIKTKRH